jgi:hypothetical protein
MNKPKNVTAEINIPLLDYLHLKTLLVPMYKKTPQTIDIVQHNCGMIMKINYICLFKGYSTKQNPHGVFLNLSNPIIIRLTSPHFENSSYICSSVV